LRTWCKALISIKRRLTIEADVVDYRDISELGVLIEVEVEWLMTLIETGGIFELYALHAFDSTSRAYHGLVRPLYTVNDFCISEENSNEYIFLYIFVLVSFLC
jgi:hypothetical protein